MPIITRARLLQHAKDLENEAQNYEKADRSGHLLCCGNNMANWMRNVAKDIRLFVGKTRP